MVKEYRFTFMFFLLFIVSVLACSDQNGEKILDPQDYNKFLSHTDSAARVELDKSHSFWNNRLNADTTGVGELGPLAGVYSRYFDHTGQIQYLKDAETVYKRAIAISAHNKDGFTRGLARNYISQHRFEEARDLLEASKKQPSNKYETDLMLFDVYMELGEYGKAGESLENVANERNFAYLIRHAKWSDHRGNLDEAIRYLEKAKEIAESSDIKELKIWIYSNIADFYGHAGRISDSYRHYLKTLALDPDNAYVKKGIAWIAYAHDNDPEEANRILDAVLLQRQVPDYHLLKAEIAKYQNDIALHNKEISTFKRLVADPRYGAMYNTYLIEIYADENPSLALELARTEVQNRATPETYDLLAFAELHSGDPVAALKIYEEQVAGKTFEPVALFRGALIYKANGMTEKVASLQSELEAASFELGPAIMKEIKEL